MEIYNLHIEEGLITKLWTAQVCMIRSMTEVLQKCLI